MKRILALILVLCMAVCMLAGCGDKDEKKKKDSQASIKKGDMFDMLEEMGNTSTGEVKMNFDFAVTESNKFNGGIDVKTDAENNACSIGFTFKGNMEGKDLNLTLDDVLVMADGYLCINLPEIAKALGGVEPQLKDMIDTSKLGWFKFPLPDDMPKFDAAFQKKLVGTFVGLFENMTKKAEMSGDDGDCTAKFASKESLVQAIVAFRDFVKSDLKGLMNSIVEKTMGINIDLNKYVDKLIKEYKADALEVGKAYGLDEATLNQYIDQIKAQDLNKMLEEAKKQGEGMSSQMLTDEQIDGIVKNIDQVIERANASENDPKAELLARVYTTDDSYKADIDLKQTEGGNGKASISLEVIPGDPSVKAPTDNVMSIKSIAEMAAPLLGGGIDIPTPTDTPDPTATPTPTEAPAATPTPTEAPEATPTPTAAPTEAPTEKETSYKDGKLNLVLSNGKVLSCEIPGNYKLNSASGTQAILLDGVTTCAFTYQDFSAYSQDLVDTTIATMLKSYGEGIECGDWKIYEYGGVRLGIQVYQKQLVIVSSNADVETFKGMLNSIKNFDIK
ncbi:MAG: hypothetical protein J5531_01780 [Lachnospiraceae bacterium]|nr:hypothetical protein [Lachnospiraceae bacterium]